MSPPARGLGATIAIAYLPDGLRGQRMLPVAAFVGGSVAVMLTYAVGRSARRERDAATLILAGVTVTAFFTAWQTFVQQQNSETLQEVYSWILGNIPSTGWSDVVLILPYVSVAIIVILALRRVVDVLNLGDDEAASLGVDVRRVRLVLVVAATLGTAAAVAVTGLIGFVGIIVPHTIRLLTGVGYRALLPLSVIVGAGFLVLADVVARTALSPAEVPLGVVTAFFGAPFFALVLRTTRAGSAMSAIELRGVTVELGGRPVVDALDAVVEQGEWVALIGPNGAGKTTLLRAIARLVPYRGEIALGGRSSAELGRSELARLVAVVPQEPSTPPWMTVAEYVLLGRTPHLGPLGEGGRPRPRRRRSSARAARSHPVPRAALGDVERRREAARRRRARARAGGVDRPPRRADCGARHRAPAAGARSSRRAARGVGAHARRGHARPHARRAVRGAHAAAERGALVADGTPMDVLTEASIEQHYGAAIDVVPVGNRIAIVPRRPASSRRSRLGAAAYDAGVRVLAVLLVVLAVPVTALASGPAKVYFEDTVPSGSSSSVTIQTHRAAAFKVLLRVPTAGRAKLFLLGKTAPKGGALIDTKTYACDGAAGSFYCKGSYEPLPKGTYTWRITWVSIGEAWSENAGARRAHGALVSRLRSDG